MCTSDVDVISDNIREQIALNKATAIAKRCAKERTARNKATAVAKRLVLARKPSWNITPATDEYFGIAEINNSAQVGPRGLAYSSNDGIPNIVEINVSSVGPSGLTYIRKNSFCAMSSGYLGI